MEGKIRSRAIFAPNQCLTKILQSVKCKLFFSQNVEEDTRRSQPILPITDIDLEIGLKRMYIYVYICELYLNLFRLSLISIGFLLGRNTFTIKNVMSKFKFLLSPSFTFSYLQRNWLKGPERAHGQSIQYPRFHNSPEAKKTYI